MTRNMLINPYWVYPYCLCIYVIFSDMRLKYRRSLRRITPLGIYSAIRATSSLNAVLI